MDIKCLYFVCIDFWYAFVQASASIPDMYMCGVCIIVSMISACKSVCSMYVHVYVDVYAIADVDVYVHG